MLNKKIEALMLALLLCAQGSVNLNWVAAVSDDDDYEFDDYNDDEDYADDEDYDDDDEDYADDDDELEEETETIEVKDSEDETDAAEDSNSKAKEAAQRKLDQLQEEYESLEKKTKAAKANLSAQQGRVNQEGQRQQAISAQIDNVVAQIGLLRQKQEIIEKDIGKKKAELEKKQKRIQAQTQFLSSYFTNSYKNGGYLDDSYLELLFGKKDFFSALTAEKFQTIISQKRREVIEALKAEKEGLEKAKTELEEKKKELEKTKAALANKNKQLEQEYNVTAQRVKDLKAMEEMLKQNYDELKKQEEEYQREISRILSQIKSMSDTYVGGELAWPVPGYFNISSPFGWRTLNGRADNHGGIDIAGSGIYGKNVVAANSGKVVYVNHADSKGYGSYGKYILLDHGGGIVTLYGHLSSISVSQDQMVAKGEKIGEVGETGYAFGAHLHFEVRENGTRVNPLPYLHK